MPRINGDFRPIASGIGHLGVNAATNGPSAFNISTMTPFGHIIQLSGIFVDPLLGQSGVIRYSRAAAAFQVSVDGGASFNNVATAGGTVTSIGVIGDVNLTGNVDLATVASGFMTIQDTGDASPLLFAVDNQGLSGFWRFPTQGFNGRVVNALTDANGTEVQGVVSVVGASGIVADIIGQTLTITPGNTIPRSYASTVASATTWTVTHNLNSLNVIVQTYDDTGTRFAIQPDDIVIVDANTVTVSWNQAQAGLVVVFAAY